MSNVRYLSAVLLAVIGLFSGCSSEPPAVSQDKKAADREDLPQGAGEKPAAEKKPVIHTVDLKTLPKVESFSPPLDEGRVVVPFLPGWNIPPRSSDWLFRWKLSAKDTYPIIFLTVQENAAPLAADQLTKENAEKFAAAWQQELLGEHSEKSFRETAHPVKLGSRYAVECEIYSATEKLKLTQRLVVVVEQGRMYLFELRAIRGTLEDFQPFLYALAAGLKAQVPMTPTEDATPAAEPAPAEDEK